VFAVVVTINGHTHKGVANVGVRPTVGGDTKPILEVHLFDFANESKSTETCSTLKITFKNIRLNKKHYD